MTRKVNKKWMHCHLHFILNYFENHQSPRKSTMPICYEKVTENSCRIITHIFVIYWLCLHLAQDGLWKPLHTHWNPCKHVRPLINNLKNHIILKLGNFVNDIVFTLNVISMSNQYKLFSRWYIGGAFVQKTSSKDINQYATLAWKTIN